MLGVGLSVGVPTAVFGAVCAAGMLLGAAVGVAMAPGAWLLLRRSNRAFGDGNVDEKAKQVPIAVVNESEMVVRLRIFRGGGMHTAAVQASPEELIELAPVGPKENFVLMVYDTTTNWRELAHAQVQRGGVYRLL